MLEDYLQKFSNLRTDRSRKRYPAYTLYGAPHKPFLLLSIMDLSAQGSVTKNFIESSFELLDTFNTYWKSIMPGLNMTAVVFDFPIEQSLNLSNRQNYRQIGFQRN